MSPHSPVSRLFAARPLAAVGRWSYGIYLFHYPFALYAYYRGWSRLPTLGIVAAGTVGMTTLSWLTLERPAIRWMTHRAGRSVPAAGTAVVTTPM